MTSWLRKKSLLKIFVLFTYSFGILLCSNTSFASPKLHFSNVTYIDSVRDGDGWFSVEFKSVYLNPMKNAKISVEVQQKINNFICEQWDDPLHQKSNDIENLVKSYGMSCLKEYGNDSEESSDDWNTGGGYAKSEIIVIFENDEFVTLLNKHTRYCCGAAHESYDAEGFTFSKKDGHILGDELLANYDKKSLGEAIATGLEKYFNCDADELLAEVSDFVEGIENIYQIPLPQTKPYLTKDGIELQYQPYEIASFAAGMPFCVIPNKKSAVSYSNLNLSNTKLTFDAWADESQSFVIQSDSFWNIVEIPSWVTTSLKIEDNSKTIVDVTLGINNHFESRKGEIKIQTTERMYTIEVIQDGVHYSKESGDLGLSVQWNTCNLESASSEEFGKYCTWNEIHNYNESGWRLPTKEEQEELLGKCICVNGSKNGVDGRWFVSRNDNAIFFPNAGYYIKDDKGDYTRIGEGEAGCYLSSSEEDALQDNILDGSFSVSYMFNVNRASVRLVHSL